MPRIGYGGGLSGDAVCGLALKGLAPILRRKLGQNRKSVMKVVTLKNIPESARTWRGRTDGWIFRARARDALNRSGSVAIPQMAGNGARRSQEPYRICQGMGQIHRCAVDPNKSR